MTTATHDDLMGKLVEHETAITDMGQDIKAINRKIDPIVKSLNSIAWAFKGLLALGAGSAAVVGIIELWRHV